VIHYVKKNIHNDERKKQKNESASKGQMRKFGFLK
jgi:hypothetical protein